MTDIEQTGTEEAPASSLSIEEVVKFEALFQLCKASYPDLDEWVLRGLVLMYLRNELPEEVDDHQTNMAKRFNIEEGAEVEG